MFSSYASTPIYVNKGFVLDLTASLVEGYIESNFAKNALALTGNIRTSKDYKVQKNSDDKTSNTTSDDSSYFDGRLDYRTEFSTKKIFTTFSFFNNVRDMLIAKNLVREINEKDIIENRIKCGEYVEFKGGLSTTSLLSTVSTLTDILGCYDTKTLDSLFKDKVYGFNNCTTMLNHLKCLCNCLNRNGTTDLVMNFGSCRAVLDVNTNNFCDKNACTYDTANSECRVLCKVIKRVDKDNCICLLRKTAMSDFYNSFLSSLPTYLKVLNDNGIITPSDFTTRIVGPALQAIPIAMYV